MRIRPRTIALAAVVGFATYKILQYWRASQIQKASELKNVALDTVTPEQRLAAFQKFVPEEAVQYLPAIIEAAKKEGVSAILLLSIGAVESGGFTVAPDATSKNKSDGTIDHGLFQINEKTLQDKEIPKGLDWRVPEDSARMAARTFKSSFAYMTRKWNPASKYLKKYKQKISTEALPKNEETFWLSVAAYNKGNFGARDEYARLKTKPDSMEYVQKVKAAMTAYASVMPPSPLQLLFY